jgi:hypothetical protein
VRFRDSDGPEVLVAASGGHTCLALASLPFLGAGLLTMAMGLGILPGEGSPSLLGGIAFVAFGSLFVAAGLGLILRRLLEDSGGG